MTTKFPQPIKELLEQYKQYLQTQGKADNTISQYLGLLENIPEDVRAYFANKNLKAKKSKVAAYRSYLRFLTFITKDITHEQYNEALETFKPPKKRGNQHSDRKFSIPKKEWNDYIDKAPHNIGKMGMWIMFYFGTRVGETVHLRVQDIDFNRNLILIREHKKTKTNEYWRPKHFRERSIPFTDKQARIFRRWIDEIRPNDLEHNYLLWTYTNHRPLQERNLERYVKKTGITPHICRYSFATHFYNLSKDIKIVGDLLGHANTSTTSEYLVLDKKETMQKARDLFNQ